MKIFIKTISFILLASVLLLSLSCNSGDEKESQILDSESSADDATENETEKKTEKKTEKLTEKATREIKATEPPTALENTDGLDLNIKILSQNLRCADDEGNNSVKERTTRFSALLDEYNPDIVGTQECTLEWFTYLRSIEGYEVIGSSRDGNRAMSGEWNAIMYNSERFVLMDSNTFWLTSTPDKPGRISEALCNRICTWVELFDTYTGLRE